MGLPPFFAASFRSLAMFECQVLLLFPVQIARHRRRCHVPKLSDRMTATACNMIRIRPSFRRSTAEFVAMPS